VIAARPFPAAVTSRLQAEVPRMARLMEDTILEEVPHYAADPERYRETVLQLCKLAVRIFLRILVTGRPPSPREVDVVQRVGDAVAGNGEPLEAMLHALRIGGRVGWDATLRASLEVGGVAGEELLPLAGQVFEYIDQLSSRIAEAYARRVEAEVRSRALSETALFEELVSGRSGPEQVEARDIARPRVALALAAGGPDRAAAQRTADSVAGRVRARFPRSVVGHRNGLSIWLLAREPLPQVLAACAPAEDVAFGISAASEDVSLARAVEEAVVAARIGLELAAAGGERIHVFDRLHAYAALRADPVGLARCQTALLGPLRAHPALLHTLRVWLQSNRSISATAARVHLHRQSVIYRMRRVSELLGVSLDDAEALWRLEAAVRTLPS
jgi:hypothetical protein